MLEKQGRWLESLRPPSEFLNPVLQAFSDLKDHLENCSQTESFLPDADLYEHIAYAHMGCRMSLEEIADAFRAEIEETLEILNSEAERIFTRHSLAKGAATTASARTSPRGRFRGVPAHHRPVVPALRGIEMRFSRIRRRVAGRGGGHSRLHATGPLQRRFCGLLRTSAPRRDVLHSGRRGVGGALRRLPDSVRARNMAGPSSSGQPPLEPFAGRQTACGIFPFSTKDGPVSPKS